MFFSWPISSISAAWLHMRNHKKNKNIKASANGCNVQKIAKIYASANESFKRTVE